MQKWIRRYDRRRRLGVNSQQPTNESWISSKYDTGIHWTELERIYLPEINMTWGQACSAIKKSWFSYKMAGKSGMYRGDIAYRIQNIQRVMGIPITEFDELEGLNDEEEIQLKKEEEDEGERNPDLQQGLKNPEEEEEENDNWIGEFPRSNIF
jgi:hypothetical protein